MLKVEDEVLVGPYLIKIIGNRRENQYWIRWANWFDLFPRKGFETFMKSICGQKHFGHFSKKYFKDLDPEIKYKSFEANDSPDFSDLESVERFIGLLKTYFLSRQIKVLNYKKL